jgi:hypothetical protein
MQKYQSLYLSDVVDASDGYRDFVESELYCGSAQSHVTGCVNTAYVKQIFWLHDLKYIETTYVPKRVCQVLLY